MSADRHTLTVRIDAGLYRSLLALCRVRGVSVNGVVVEAIERTVAELPAEEAEKVRGILNIWTKGEEHGLSAN